MKQLLAVFVVLALCTPMLTKVYAQSSSPIGPTGPPQGPISPVQMPSPVSSDSPPSSALPPEELTPNGEPKGKLVKTYRKDKKKNDKKALPDWVDKAVKHSKDHLKDFKNAFIIDLADADAELEPIGADEDNLGTTVLRLQQVHKGVPVLGSHIIVQLKNNKVNKVIGHIIKEARKADTAPSLDSAQAIEAAKAALGYQGKFAVSPEAELIILPHQTIDPAAVPGATLAYQVELLIEDGTNENTARWFYFVNAQNGSIIWRYDAMGRGTGQSLYSGIVSFPSFYRNYYYTSYLAWCGGYYWNAGHLLYDGTGAYGNLETSDVHHSSDQSFLGYVFLNPNDNQFGITSRCAVDAQREQAAVDVQFNQMKTWDFYHNWLGRRGIDGAGYYLLNRVHFGSNYNNAGWNGSNIFYGDGDGYLWYPFVTTDISAHEFTHGVIEKTMNGNFFSNQGRAMAESFGDSMGTMVEFYAGIRPDYLYSEDNKAGLPDRSLENPPSINNDPDHFLNYD